MYIYTPINKEVTNSTRSTKVAYYIKLFVNCGPKGQTPYTIKHSRNTVFVDFCNYRCFTIKAFLKCRPDIFNPLNQQFSSYYWHRRSACTRSFSVGTYTMPNTRQAYKHGHIILKVLSENKFSSDMVHMVYHTPTN